MLTMASALAATPGRHCTYLFAAFDSEEAGFAGSRFYVQHPTLPLERVRVMIDLGRVGHVSQAGLLVLGSTLDPSLAAAVRARQAGKVPCDDAAAGHVESAMVTQDQAAFVLAGLPTLFVYGYRSRVITPAGSRDRITPPAARPRAICLQDCASDGRLVRGSRGVFQEAKTKAPDPFVAPPHKRIRGCLVCSGGGCRMAMV